MIKKAKLADKPIELTQEQFDEILKKIDDFNLKFFIALAGTDRFEIVPTSEGDNCLTPTQYSLIRTECSKLGLKIIYKIQAKDSIIYVNSENGKIGFCHDGVH